MTCASTAATCVPRTESASGQAVDLIRCVPTARSCSRVVTWQLPTPQGPASWKAATDLRSLREVGVGAQLAHHHTSALCPDATDAGGRRAGPSQGHPRAHSRRLPTEACHRCPGPRRAKATASAGPPDSRSGVCCKGAGEMLGSVEALPSLSPGHPPSGAALAGPRHTEACGLP